jgi:hypothetical protein
MRQWFTRSALRADGENPRGFKSHSSHQVPLAHRKSTVSVHTEVVGSIPTRNTLRVNVRVVVRRSTQDALAQAAQVRILLHANPAKLYTPSSAYGLIV